MKRYQIIAGVLISITAVSFAQALNLTLLTKKGAILDSWIDPASPTSSTDVTLHVSVEDGLQLDHVDIQQIANMFIVKIYWDEPADGSNIASGSPPTYHEEPLGTLSAGTYFVSIRSYYQSRLVDMDYLSFRVIEAPPEWATQNIDAVWIEPEAPTTSDTATLHVSVKWPTTGFSLNRLSTMALQRTVIMKMYWSSPDDDATVPIITPYEHEATLRHLVEGTYTVRVESYLDGKLVDWAEMSFEVKPAG
jgi:hypothetical protein